MNNADEWDKEIRRREQLNKFIDSIEIDDVFHVGVHEAVVVDVHQNHISYMLDYNEHAVVRSNREFYDIVKDTTEFKLRMLGL